MAINPAMSRTTRSNRSSELRERMPQRNENAGIVREERTAEYTGSKGSEAGGVLSPYRVRPALLSSRLVLPINRPILDKSNI